MPYAKPKFTKYGKAYYITIGKNLQKFTTKVRYSEIFFKKNLKSYQVSPKLDFKIGRIKTFIGLDYHYLNKRKLENFNFKVHSRISAKLGIFLPTFDKLKMKIETFFGKRLFSYQGTIIENHPREQLYGGKVVFIYPIKQIKLFSALTYKRFKELKTGRKANIYGIGIGLNF